MGRDHRRAPDLPYALVRTRARSKPNPGRPYNVRLITIPTWPSTAPCHESVNVARTAVSSSRRLSASDANSPVPKAPAASSHMLFDLPQRPQGMDPASAGFPKSSQEVPDNCGETCNSSGFFARACKTPGASVQSAQLPGFTRKNGERTCIPLAFRHAGGQRFKSFSAHLVQVFRRTLLTRTCRRPAVRLMGPGFREPSWRHYWRLSFSCEPVFDRRASPALGDERIHEFPRIAVRCSAAGRRNSRIACPLGPSIFDCQGKAPVPAAGKCSARTATLPAATGAG